MEMKKLEATELLASGVSHDFNNLLAVFSCYIDLAKEETAPKSTLRSMLSQIDEASLRAHCLPAAPLK